jgi:hypothetical protein
VVIGALAVGVHAEVRATGDVDVMVPIEDDANRRALRDALAQLSAVLLSSEPGGVDPVAGKDDLIRMKLAAGHTDDLRDVANLTASEQGAPRVVLVSMVLAPEVDREWARDMAAERAAYFDVSSRVRIAENTHLEIEARRSDLTDRQIEQWARALADRLEAVGVLAGADIDVQVRAA